VNRSAALDKLRGLAIVLMMLDHLLVQIDPQSLIRTTITRACVPLFFVIAGHLLRPGIKWQRLILILIIGAALPHYAPWVDSPNVLVWYATLTPIVAWGNRAVLAGTILAALTLYANGYGQVEGSYAPMALAAFMAAGRLAPRESLERVGSWGQRPCRCLDTICAVPRERTWARGIAAIGQYPLSIYVGHILVIESVARWTS